MPGLIGCPLSHELLREMEPPRERIGHTAPTETRRNYAAGLSGSEPVLAALPESQQRHHLELCQVSEFQALANEAGPLPFLPREQCGRLLNIKT